MDSPHKGPVTQGFDVFLNEKLLNKQMNCLWSEMPWCSCDVPVPWDVLSLHLTETVDETASHDQVAHKIGCLYIPLLF